MQLTNDPFPTAPPAPVVAYASGVGKAAKRQINDNEHLTQYGTCEDGEWEWHSSPRIVDRGELSLIAGSHDPLAAAAIVRSRGPLGDGTDAARYTTAGTLRERLHGPPHSEQEEFPARFGVLW